MKRIIQIIKKYKKFIISTHVNPDPDALCSELALAGYLRSIGKKVTIVNQDQVLKRYQFLKGIKHVKSLKEAKRLDFEAAIIVDCGELSRIGKVSDIIKGKHHILNIDHHITNTLFGQCNLVDTKASSTAEIIYNVITAAKGKISSSMAQLLYMGIMTDTGSFRFENTTAKTHEIVSHLMKFNIAVDKIYRVLYETIPNKDVKVLAQVMSRYGMLSNGRIVYVQLRKKDLRKFSEEFDLRDTIFKFLRSIKGVEVFVIFSEIARNKTRINLRSTDKVNVAKIASTFGGGGHRRASGCMLGRRLNDTRVIVLNNIKKHL